MPGLRTEFGRDIIILLVVTIVTGSLLAAGIGYLSDLYFGDLTASLVGGAGDRDVMLIVNQQQEKAARRQIEQIAADKLPGAEVTSGVRILGRVNFFIKLLPRHRGRSTFIKVEDYFRQVDGLESFSLITEPRITVRGLKPKVRNFLADKLAARKGVEFTVPDGDKLEIIITRSEQLTTVKQTVQDLLDSYRVVTVNFPLPEQPDNLFVIAERLVSHLTAEREYPIYNVTEAGDQKLEKLVTTMVEMKQFLRSYASQVKVQEAAEEVKPGDKLVVPGLNKQQIVLRVVAENSDGLSALIVEGDSRQIISNQAYKLQDGQLGTKVGEIEVNNPRQELAYVINQLTTILPVLQSSWQESKAVIPELLAAVGLFEELKPAITQLKVTNRQLKVYQQELDQLQLDQLRTAVTKLEANLQRVAEVARRLQFVKDLLEQVTGQLEQAEGQLLATSQALDPASPYRQEVKRLEDTVDQLVTRVDQNTAPIVAEINKYNPLLKQIITWQAEVEQVKKILNQGEKFTSGELKKLVTSLTDQQVVAQLEDLSTSQVSSKLSQLQDDLQIVSRLDIKAVITELKSIQRTLPQLKDEEITASIDLIDEYIAGRVIPGKEISLLVPARKAAGGELEKAIKQFIAEPVSLSRSQPGIIEPSFRTQLYQILGEVRMVLAAVTAVIWTIFSLLFDQTVIIISLQLLFQDANRLLAVVGDLYGTAVGSLLLGSMFKLARIDLPYIPWPAVIFLGGGLGLITARAAEQITDISTAEFEAGRALGFSYPEIMRQIVIPAANPGFLKFFNQAKTYFH